MTNITNEIKIMAEPSTVNPSLCKLTIDHLLYDGSLRCSSVGLAQGSPLFRAFFNLQEVKEVHVQQNTIQILLKEAPKDWRPLAKEMGTIIREQFSLHGPLFPLDFIQTLNPQPQSRPQMEVKPDLSQNPQAKKLMELLETHINPSVASHGGKISLVDYRDGDVYLKMEGGCQGCGQASLTLRQGVEKLIKQHLPEIKNIIDVTDHQGGANPYY